MSEQAPFGHCPSCLIQLGFGPITGETEVERVKVGKIRTFGDYELIEQIGRGGMGVVYKARQVGLNRPVALKMILAGELASAASVERFHIEAEAAANLDHANIVPIFDIGENAGSHYFSMKLVEGDSLDKLMSEFVLPKPDGAPRSKAVLRQAHSQIARLLATLAGAVEYAHQHGILHRDLKPSNILIDAEGTPHLTDFGLAKITSRGDSVTESGDIIGSLSYMAPEQAEGTRVSAAADIYSLGAILFELLTGKPPFRAETPIETLRQVTEQEPERPQRINSLIDPDLATICLKCLEKDPQRRYATARDLATDLDRWERFEPIRARPANAALRVRRWTRRNRMGTALIVTLFAGLALALTLWQLKRIETWRAQMIVNSLRQESMSELAALEKPPLPYVEINSDALAALVTDNISPRPIRKRYRVGVLVDVNAADTAYKYGPLLQYLERAISRKIGVPIAFDVRVYRDREAGANDLVRGELGFMRMLPLQYVHSHALNAGVRPLVRASNAWEAVIFARQDTGVRNLADLQGKSIAFGEPNATITLLAESFLARAGVLAKDLRTNMFANQFGDGQAGQPQIEREYLETGYNYSKSVAIRSVLSDGWDAGVALRNYLYLNHEGKEFRTLQSFRDVTSPWVASAEMEVRVSEAFRQAMIEIADPKIAEALPPAVADASVRYVAARDEDYDVIRECILFANAYKGAAAPSPNPRPSTNAP